MVALLVFVPLVFALLVIDFGVAVLVLVAVLALFPRRVFLRRVLTHSHYCAASAVFMTNPGRHSTNSASGEFPLISVAENPRQILQRHPLDLGNLRVSIRKFPTGKPQQIMVNSLMDPLAIGEEPIVNSAQTFNNLPLNAGFLANLANSRHGDSLIILNMPLGKRPEEAPTAIRAANKRHLHRGQIHPICAGIISTPHITEY